MIKIDVFDKTDGMSHINSFEQVLHCRDSIIKAAHLKTTTTATATTTSRPNLFQVNIIRQFHVLCMNTENFQSTSSIGNSNVNLPVKSAWTHNKLTILITIANRYVGNCSCVVCLCIRMCMRVSACLKLHCSVLGVSFCVLPNIGDINFI